ncbi:MULTISPECIES: class I SAM-dependent methyltransferase [unclassified Herbaspirillum]|uniref:class I SAM-dependent methyltransferase n=1 Tax=unclassified Herbaspirillum TaxID=2624150 RepID=UPI00114D5593|nr:MULTISPECIES: class I SAM-dependent methyltransferase [unclassified Herbaspirillum]MBB5390094.1 2-polyprenyl-3-methyl-5-hydroxy-6-metoxy-1,4-benzoquinol methylase [Herbaspirillum sp. SJZ102]TQK09407.1 methyltransferase family protein [Herbaspirillum sp. SJZ130]TQK13906.1 methyltransferase family protein [Herbaspirillum sp. SJZ106]
MSVLTVSPSDFDVATQPGMRDQLAEIYKEFRTKQTHSQHVLHDSEVTYRLNCPSCLANTENATVLFEKNGVPHVQCHTCGLVYTSMTLTDAADAAQYDDTEFMRAYVRLKRHSLFTRLEVTKARFLLQQAIRHHHNLKTVLDVGASTGAVLAAANYEKIEAYGIEPDSAMAEPLNEQFPGRVINGYFPTDIAPLWPPFDLITLLDVLEHMITPVSFARSLKNNLAPNGLVLIQVPNYNSLLVRLEGSRNSNYCVGHWQHFTDTTLTDVMGRAGYRCLETGTCITEFDRIMAFRDEEKSRTIQDLLGTTAEIKTPEDLYRYKLGYKLYGLFAPT